MQKGTRSLPAVGAFLNLSYPRFAFSIRVRMWCASISTAVLFSPPLGTMMSALRLLGSNKGFVHRLDRGKVLVYITLSKLRPRSFTSRRMRRRMRSSASVSTKIL